MNESQTFYTFSLLLSESRRANVHNENYYDAVRQVFCWLFQRRCQTRRIGISYVRCAATRSADDSVMACCQPSIVTVYHGDRMTVETVCDRRNLQWQAEESPLAAMILRSTVTGNGNYCSERHLAATKGRIACVPTYWSTLSKATSNTASRCKPFQKWSRR